MAVGPCSGFRRPAGRPVSRPPAGRAIAVRLKASEAGGGGDTFCGSCAGAGRSRAEIPCRPAGPSGSCRPGDGADVCPSKPATVRVIYETGPCGSHFNETGLCLRHFYVISESFFSGDETSCRSCDGASWSIFISNSLESSRYRSNHLEFARLRLKTSATPAAGVGRPAIRVTGTGPLGPTPGYHPSHSCSRFPSIHLNF